uniref:No apical meristem-associated C-terminal domain-containing protein n=1 Tax=Setaria italica TaxID=4555 RepID=K3XRZ9_SETIT
MLFILGLSICRLSLTYKKNHLNLLLSSQPTSSLSGSLTPQATVPPMVTGEVWCRRCLLLQIARPRLSNVAHPSSSLPTIMPLQAKRAAAPQGASPSSAQASKATASSIATNPTWLSMPPAFVPNCSSPIVNSDPNATNAELGSHPPGGFLSYFQPSDYSHLQEVSAWLKNSNDPIKGNWKRNDQYWGAVTDMFNSTTPIDRIREVKQLKEQWHCVNRTVNAFQSSWIKAQHLRASGESDEQVMDKAMAFYEEDFEEGQFKLIACWKVLRDQPKWHAYNEDLNGSNKTKNSESEVVDLTSSPDVLNDLLRPVECKKAKDESKGKGKGKGSSSTLDEIDKLREGQAKSKEDRIEVLERYQQIAADKKESARPNHLAAQEKEEAKLLEKEGKMHDKESKLLETYKSLLTFDTRHMLEDLKAEHMIAVKSTRERIFTNFAS